MCPCAKPAMHRGWCEWRVRTSERASVHARLFPGTTKAEQYRAYRARRNAYLFHYREPLRIATAERRKLSAEARQRSKEVRALQPLIYWPYLRVASSPDEELLLEISASLSRGIYEPVRAEVGQEMALAVLGGSLRREDIASAAPLFIRDAYRTYSSYYTLSLDAPSRPGSNRTIGDMIADLSDRWCGSGADLVFRDSEGLVVDTALTKDW